MEQNNKVKLLSWQEIGHHTVWRQVKKIYNIERPTKYCVVFNTYTDSLKSFSITSFDTLDEALEEAKLINIVYSSTPKPEKINKENYPYRRSRPRNFVFDFSNDSYFWGYTNIFCSEISRWTFLSRSDGRFSKTKDSISFKS